MTKPIAIESSLEFDTQVTEFATLASAAERDKIAAWLRGMDESTATTLANWLDAGMYTQGDEA
jgi:hypothetical protein